MFIVRKNSNGTYTKETRYLKSFLEPFRKPEIEIIDMYQYYTFIKMPIFKKMGNSWCTRFIPI